MKLRVIRVTVGVFYQFLVATILNVMLLHVRSQNKKSQRRCFKKYRTFFSAPAPVYGNQGPDHVDYGAYTGGYGAFGWYSDHPVLIH